MLKSEINHLDKVVKPYLNNIHYLVSRSI